MFICARRYVVFNYLNTVENNNNAKNKFIKENLGDKQPCRHISRCYLQLL